MIGKVRSANEEPVAQLQGRDDGAFGLRDGKRERLAFVEECPFVSRKIVDRTAKTGHGLAGGGRYFDGRRDIKSAISSAAKAQSAPLLPTLPPLR